MIAWRTVVSLVCSLSYGYEDGRFPHPPFFFDGSEPRFSSQVVSLLVLELKAWKYLCRWQMRCVSFWLVLIREIITWT
jgi:hypothetical protein